MNGFNELNKEAYCSFEVAKLLKEKGFNGPCFCYYKDKVLMFNPSLKGRNSYQTDTYSTPTHQMAMAWLREVHHIFIEIGTSVDLNGNYHFGYTILDNKCKYLTRGYKDFNFNYEDAVEAALKYCLENLI